MVDQDGIVLLVNRQFEKLIDVDEQTLVSNRLENPELKLLGKLHLPEADSPRAIVQSLSALEAEDSPTSIQLESPETRVLERMVHGVTDASGGRIGWLIVLRDVSEERELEETREQLVEMIVHDLRSPLSTIKGGLSLLNKALPEEKRSELTAQALSVSERAVTQMLGLVNSLLDLARLENDPLEIKTETLHLGRLLDELAETFIPEANQAGLILDVAATKNLPLIEADEDKLRRVLSNLLDNAVKFTPEGGHISLSAQANGGENILVTVADDGPGVPEDMRQRIFDRFSQVPGVAGRRRGTGLGLAFARLAVEAHQGRIWVEANNGQGSRFNILLPVKSAKN
jgi:signal transduction histidine kinase